MRFELSSHSPACHVAFMWFSFGLHAANVAGAPGEIAVPKVPRGGPGGRATIPDVQRSQYLCQMNG
eukprot:1493741-Pyramimonas_sp.AAC.1